MKTSNKIFLGVVCAVILVVSVLIIVLMTSLKSARPGEATNHAAAVKGRTLNLNVSDQCEATPAELQETEYPAEIECMTDSAAVSSPDSLYIPLPDVEIDNAAKKDSLDYV